MIGLWRGIDGERLMLVTGTGKMGDNVFPTIQLDFRMLKGVVDKETRTNVFTPMMPKYHVMFYNSKLWGIAFYALGCTKREGRATALLLDERGYRARVAEYRRVLVYRRMKDEAQW